MLKLFNQIYLDSDQLIIGHLYFDQEQKSHYHLFSYPKQNTQRLVKFVNNLALDQRRNYISFASRFFEMPILVLDESRIGMTSKDLLRILNLRRSLLTSLDSVFNIVKKYPGLWTKQEMQLLSTWQHNPHYWDIRTLDGRIDHGELTRFPRYLLEMGLPITDQLAAEQQIKQDLLNLKELFFTEQFQNSFKAHNFLMKKYHDEITKDPHESWAGMMTIMPTTTDAETIEAVLYRDHHIKDKMQVHLDFPTFKTSWAKDLLSFYTKYQGLKRQNKGSLSAVRKELSAYKPPIIKNPDGNIFFLAPSEGGIHGITVNLDDYEQVDNWQTMNKFSQPVYSQRIYKIDRPHLYPIEQIRMDGFDSHAKKIVQEMVDFAENNPASIEKLAYERLLHAIKGAGDTSFDNHLKAPNLIMQLRLQVQLKMIDLIEKMHLAGINIYSVNALVTYISIPDEMTEKDLQDLLKETDFELTDIGHDFYAKSSNNHFYISQDKGMQAAGDGVNHYAGTNVYTDQQRPTIVEKVFVDLLSQKHGHLNEVKFPEVVALLEKYLRDFDPLEWMQPLLTSPLKEIFAIDLKTKRVATPAMRAFYVKSGTKDATQVQRIYLSNKGKGDSKALEEIKLAKLDQRFNLTRKNAYFENNYYYQGRIFLIVDDLGNIDKQDLKEKLDLQAYADLVVKLLITWVR